MTERDAMVAANLPFPTTDARLWAAEFVRLHGGDEGLMLSWFANAIEHGRGPDGLRAALARAVEGGYAESSIDLHLYHNDPVYHAVVWEVRKHRAALEATPAALAERLHRFDHLDTETECWAPAEARVLLGERGEFYPDGVSDVQTEGLRAALDEQRIYSAEDFTRFCHYIQAEAALGPHAGDGLRAAAQRVLAAPRDELFAALEALEAALATPPSDSLDVDKASEVERAYHAGDDESNLGLALVRFDNQMKNDLGRSRSRSKYYYRDLAALLVADGWTWERGAGDESLRAAAQEVLSEWDQTIAEGGLVTIALQEPIDALRAALAAPPSDSLDVAWAEAEAALPDGWRIELDRVAYSEDGDDTGWWASCSPSGRAGRDQVGPFGTPAAALRALVAALAPEVTR